MNNWKINYSTLLINLTEISKTRPGDLVMLDPLELLFSQCLDYFRPYKNQVNLVIKDIQLNLGSIFLDHLGPFGTIKNKFMPY